MIKSNHRRSLVQRENLGLSRLFLTSILLSSSSLVSASASAYVAGSREYMKIPDDYALQQVIIVHRHGDRAQIARSIGPKYPESTSIADIWRTKLPTSSSLAAMASVAQSTYSVTAITQGLPTEKMKENTLAEELYAGEDMANSPYAQLTEIGAQQLMSVGRELRRRYLGAHGFSFELAEAPSNIYARSTNMCRTLQSLRSLLAGLFAVDSTAPSALHSSTGLKISTRPKSQEVMFPTADGPCESMVERRNIIFPPNFMEQNLEGYSPLEAKVKAALGYSDKVGWLAVKEILTCSKVHGIPFPEGLTADDEKSISRLAGWMWGALYKDKTLNRLAIGRFLTELLDDILVNHKDKKMLIYSGHDSTLVPVLCALDCYDDKWPPYASYLSLEIVESKKSGEKFVRALYNDEPIAILGESNSSQDPWCSLDSFINRLREMSIGSEEYKTACVKRAVIDEVATKAYEAEVKATIG